MWTPNEVIDLLEKLSGEQVGRAYVPLEGLQRRIKNADAKIAQNGEDVMSLFQKIGSQYQISWGVRGDNTPEYARYLGYLDVKELYPDFDFLKFEPYLMNVVEGKAEPLHAEMKANVDFSKLNSFD
jgi:hypothetical protein